MLMTLKSFIISKQKLKLFNKEFVHQFFSYFFIGGCAAIVELIFFWIVNVPFGQNIYISTILAFLIATFTNWILGRNITFKKVAKTKKPVGDALAIYFVSGIALGLNLLLMAFFVNILGIYPLFSKIIATGIAFLWNFLSRRYIVYKK